EARDEEADSFVEESGPLSHGEGVEVDTIEGHRSSFGRAQAEQNGEEHALARPWVAGNDGDASERNACGDDLEGDVVSEGDGQVSGEDHSGTHGRPLRRCHLARSSAFLAATVRRLCASARWEAEQYRLSARPVIVVEHRSRS